MLHLLNPTMIISCAYRVGKKGLDLDITDTSSYSQLAHKSNQFIAVCQKKCKNVKFDMVHLNIARSSKCLGMLWPRNLQMSFVFNGIYFIEMKI